MSRSRKHTPSCNVVKPDGAFKRFFNKRLRKMPLDAIPSGGAYKRLNESWMIHDWREVGPSFVNYCKLYERDPTDPEVRYGYERIWLLK